MSSTTEKKSTSIDIATVPKGVEADVEVHGVPRATDRTKAWMAILGA